MFSPKTSRTSLALTTALVALTLYATPLIAQLEIGSDTNSGTLEVRGTSSDQQLIFEVGTDVVVGRGGLSPADVDLLVMDPVHPTESIFQMNAGNGFLTLGSGSAASPGDDGDISVVDSQGFEAFSVDGGSGTVIVTDFNGAAALSLEGSGSASFQVSGSAGNVTNGASGNGLVKAWCQVGGDGTLIAGWRCTATRTALGTYDVDFTSVDTDIRGRPFLVSCSGPSFDPTGCEGVRARNESTDFSAVQVLTSPAASDAGPFTIVLF